jgi:hypothetical protein
MKYHSEFTKQYVDDICNALNEKGILMHHFNVPYSPENFSTLTKFLQEDILMSSDLYHFLTNKGLINRGKCPYTSQRIDDTFPSWSFMGSNRVYASHEGYEIMQREDNEEFEKVMGYPKPQRNNPMRSSRGCYIATVCYQSETAPEVIQLKKFRDDTLINFWFGRLFISTYYLFSPKISEYLKNKPKINTIIRKTVLDKIVNKITKK